MHFSTENSPNITISTIHGVKGLEFGNVWIMNVSEGSIPSKKAETKEQIEEERRLFYVAVTRAKHRLIISRHKKCGSKSLEISRFITESDFKNLR